MSIIGDMLTPKTPRTFGDLGPGSNLPEERIVPFVIGRYRVHPVAVYNRVSHYTPGGDTELWKRMESISAASDYYLKGGIRSIDVVLAFGQLGATLQGIWREKEFVGLKWNGSAWAATAGPSVLTALRRLMAADDVGGYYTYSSTGGGAAVHVPGVFTPKGHELIQNAASPWGKRFVSHPDNYADITGAYPAWGYLAGGPAEGIGFRGYSHVRAEAMVLGGVAGTSKTLPALDFLVDGAGGNDASPDVAMRAILETLMGIDPGNIVTDVGPDGRTESSFEAWCTANPILRVNGLVAGSPKDALDSLAQAAHAEIVHSEGKIKIWPLGDTVVGSYVPSQWNTGTSAWEPIVIDRRELAPGAIIKCTIADEAEVVNAIPVRYKDKAAEFEERTYTFTHDWHASTYGRRLGDAVTNPWITSTAFAALFSQRLVMASLYRRRRYNFTVSSRWIALEPGDLLMVSDGIWNSGTSSFDSILGVPGTLVRISRIDEQENGSLEIEAWEWSEGATHPVDLTPDEPTPASTIVPDGIAGTFEIIAGLAASGGEGTAAADALADAAAAQATADTALANAGKRVTYAATPPASPNTDDLWFSTDTTTNCPDSNCKGHTTDGSGVVQVGTYPHRKLYWGHRWSGAAWVDAEGQAQVIAAEIMAGAVTAAKIAAGEIKTSNYAEDGSGNPTAGAKLDHQGTALKVAAGNLQIGATVLSDLWQSGNLTAWPGSNWTLSEVSLHKVFNVVSVQMTATAGSGSTWNPIAVVPEGFRPPSSRTLVGIVVDASSGNGYLAQVNLGATVYVNAYDNGSSLVTPFAIGVGDKLYLSATFVVP